MRFAWLVVVAACVRSGATVCANGHTCPAGTQCDDLHGQCLTPEQLTACNGLPEGARCNIAGSPVGTCRDGVCLHDLCGDVYVSADETCDGEAPATGCLGFGFDIGVTGCSANCGLDISRCQHFGWIAAGPSGPPPLYYGDVWGTAANDVFVVGSGGVIWHYDEVTWLPMQSNTTADLNALWGTEPSDVYAAGSGGTILHYDGATWTAMPTPTTKILWSIWGSGPNDIYAGGTDVVLHYQGGAWTDVSGAAMASGRTIWDIWGSSATNVFFASGQGTGGSNGKIHRYNGSWSEVATSPVTIDALWGSGANDIYATAGDNVLHYTGSTWNAILNVIGAGALWGTGPDDVWAMGTLHFDGTRWTRIDGLPASVHGIWGPSQGDVYAVGYGGMLMRTRGTFALSASIGVVWVTGLTGTSPSNAYAVDFTNTIQHWDGNTWTPDAGTGIPLGAVFGSIWAVSDNDIFAVGSGTAARKTSTGWQGMSATPGEPLYAVWASDATHVFAVGGVSAGVIAMADGMTWSVMTPPPGTDVLQGVWGTSSSNVFAVGWAGTVLHYNGVQWSKMTSGTTVDLYGVGGTGPSDVYAVGDGGTILHYDGTGWAPMVSGVYSGLISVRASGLGREVFVGGYNGILLVGDGTSWTRVSATPLTTVNNIWCTGGHVFLAGQSDRVIDLSRTVVTCDAIENVCDDYWDDDCDGTVDACDGDCIGRGPPEQCANGRDDDCDFASDCADPDCASFPGC